MLIKKLTSINILFTNIVIRNYIPPYETQWSDHGTKNNDERKEARPFLIDLSDEVQETIDLVVLDQNKALYIDKGYFTWDEINKALAIANK